MCHTSASYERDDGARGNVVLKALRYMPDGRGFDTGRDEWMFSIY
jgi:hypothetical protein